MNARTRKANGLLPMLIHLAMLASNTTFIVGPNMRRKNQNAPRWSLRTNQQTGEHNTPIHEILLANVRTMSADSHEKFQGCSTRVGGDLVSPSDIPQGVSFTPLRFDVDSGNFHRITPGEDQSPVHPRFVAFRPNGMVEGILN